MDFDFIEDEGLRAQAIEAHQNSMLSLKAQTEAQIAKAVEGLSAKNAELLGEKKSIQEKLQGYAAITDPERALEALKFLDENADAQLIKDGKIGELIEKRTSVMRSDHEAALKDLQAALSEASNESKIFKTKYQSKMIEDTIRAAALEAGVLPAAITDVLARGNRVFSLSEHGEVEARDKNGNLLKNAKDMVVTPKNWVMDLKDSAIHYWPASEGAGAFSGSGNPDDIAEQLQALAIKGDMVGYRKLREKTLAKK